MQSLYSSVCLRCLPNVCYWFPLCVCSGCSSGVALATPANHRPASGSLHNIKYKQNNRVGDFYSGPHTHGASTTTTNISIFSSNTFLCLHLNRCWWKFKCNFAIAFVGGARGSVPVVFGSSSSIDNCMQRLVTRWPAVLQCCSADYGGPFLCDASPHRLVTSAADDPSVSQSVFTITENLEGPYYTRAFSWLVKSAY